MKKDSVPQDQVDSLSGEKKVVFALGNNGQYEIVPTSGWEAEEIVNKQALEEFERLADDARSRFLKGEVSPLMYHMNRCRMDVGLLAKATGIWRLRIQRHLKPKPFQRLSAQMIDRYCRVLSVTPDELRTVPE
jgi:Cro/C1-type HTH DNA-binding domain